MPRMAVERHDMRRGKAKLANAPRAGNRKQDQEEQPGQVWAEYTKARDDDPYRNKDVEDGAAARDVLWH